MNESLSIELRIIFVKCRKCQLSTVVDDKFVNSFIMTENRVGVDIFLSTLLIIHLKKMR